MDAQRNDTVENQGGSNVKDIFENVIKKGKPLPLLDDEIYIEDEIFEGKSDEYGNF